MITKTFAPALGVKVFVIMEYRQPQDSRTPSHAQQEQLTPHCEEREFLTRPREEITVFEDVSGGQARPS